MSETLMKLMAVSLLLFAAAALGEPQKEAMPSQERVQAVERSSQTYVHSDPEIPTAQEVSGYMEAVADKERRQFEQQLWDIFGRGEYVTVRRRIEERQQKVPGWKPPVWLAVELSRAEARVKIASLKNNPKAMIAMRDHYPELFNCHEYYHLWSLADAYVAVERQKVAADIHQQILSNCLDAKVLLTTLDRIADGEGPRQALEGAALLEKRKAVRLPQEELERRRYGWRVSQAVALHGEGRLEEAGTYLAAVEPMVIRRRDVGLGRLIAWNYRERSNTAAAAKWFEHVVKWSGSEEDRLHLLQLKWDVGERDEVIESLRRQPLRESRSRLWAAEILRGEGARKFDARAYAESVALLDAALAYDKPEPPSLSALRGWASLELKRYGDAHRAFADAYRSNHDVDLASGLLYSAQRSGDWKALLEVAERDGGPLLSDSGERALVVQLAEGKLTSAQVAVEEGHLVEVDETGVRPSLFRRAVRSLEGFPGSTWGSVDRDSDKDSSISYLINQGIDWVKLPGEITVGTFVEYRAIDNSLQYFRDETEAAIGLELKRYPFRLGMEYLPERWRNGEETEGNARKAYLSLYDDWYTFLRRRRGGVANPLNVDAYAGSIYGRLTHDLDGQEGTSTLGFIKQGVDWFTFAEDVTFHTYAAYRFRFRDWDSYWYNVHGPALGIELQKPPFTLGVDYAWKRYTQQNSSSETASLYLNWYYGWDLKPE